jgi:hypothetical protein
MQQAKSLILNSLFIFLPFLVFAQNLKGVILTVDTKKPIENANIYFNQKLNGTTSNYKGEFNLKIKEKINGNDTITFSCIGYKSKSYTYSELKAKDYIVYLSEKIESLQQVDIISQRKLKSKINYKELPSLEIGLHSFASILIEDKIYVFGGDESYIKDAAKLASFKTFGIIELKFKDFARRLENGNNWLNYSNELQIFDLTNEIWMTSDLKLRPRAYHTVSFADNKFYVMGGKYLKSDKEYLDDKIEVLDLESNTITIDHTNPHQAVSPVSFHFDNTIIVMGGSIKQNKNGQKTFSNECHIYDIKSGYWYKLNDMKAAKETKGVLINNTIYLVGRNQDRALSEIESFNIIDGTWNTETELYNAKEKPAIAANENTIYIFDYGRIFTYNTDTKTLNQYNIDLFLKSSELYYHNNKLYLLGGYIENEYSKTPSNKLYSIDLSEFSNTKIKHTID